MTTREILPMTTVDEFGCTPPMEEAVDLDGFREIMLYLNVQNVTNGGSTLVVSLNHAARNRSADYFWLHGWDDVVSATSSYACVTATSSTGFLRFLRVEARWLGGGAAVSADVEVLAVPKR